MCSHRHEVSLTRSFWGRNCVPFWKRSLDLVCLILALPLVVPLMLLISFVIKIVSPGPVFFRQERIGLKGQRFTCLKFRTMTHGASTQDHEQYLQALMKTSNEPMVKMDRHDPRVIKTGRLLRSSGLDELPQLINVWRGEMSWVGPRPCTLIEYKCYKPHQSARFDTLPGLTGLWQVNGKNSTTFNEMVEMDIQYALHKSLMGDLIIMLKTPLVLLMQSKDAMVKKTTVRNQRSAVSGLACQAPGLSKGACRRV